MGCFYTSNLTDRNYQWIITYCYTLASFSSYVIYHPMLQIYRYIMLVPEDISFTNKQDSMSTLVHALTYNGCDMCITIFVAFIYRTYLLVPGIRICHWSLVAESHGARVRLRVVCSGMLQPVPRIGVGGRQRCQNVRHPGNWGWTLRAVWSRWVFGLLVYSTTSMHSLS